MKRIRSDNYEFPLDNNDTILILTKNNSHFKENVGNIVSKMIVIKELQRINLNNLSSILGNMGINKLDIYSIHGQMDSKHTFIINTNKGCDVNYMDMRLDTFIGFLNYKNNIFQHYNKDSLYIVRGGNYIDIKNLFATIENTQVNLGRGGSQKAHMLSSIDFRLSCYLMAMFNFNTKLINNLNTFNYINKDRYLS